MYKLLPGENARHAAQKMVGAAHLYTELRSPGWDGNPDKVKPGQTFYHQAEKMGPPAKWAADPKHLGRNG